MNGPFENLSAEAAQQIAASIREDVRTTRQLAASVDRNSKLPRSARSLGMAKLNVRLAEQEACAAWFEHRAAIAKAESTETMEQVLAR